MSAWLKPKSDIRHMGFGFNLFFVFILLPLTLLLPIVSVLSKQSCFGKALGLLWIGTIMLVIISFVLRPIFSIKLLEKSDYYGEYVIDRSMFPGGNANWQYNSFRFEINDHDSIFFHATDGKRIIRTYPGTISTVKPYSSERLVLHMIKPTHHVIDENPETHRSTWDFYLTFKDSLYNNMFFVKGKWEPIE
jgi:hypothetical protein